MLILFAIIALLMKAPYWAVFWLFLHILFRDEKS